MKALIQTDEENCVFAVFGCEFMTAEDFIEFYDNKAECIQVLEDTFTKIFNSRAIVRLDKSDYQLDCKWRAVITTQGDRSVGINGWEVILGVDQSTVDEFSEKYGGREAFRDVLRANFGELLGEPAGVGFSDECPDCGAAGYEPGKSCKNKSCVDNLCPICGLGGDFELYESSRCGEIFCPMRKNRA